MPWEVRIITEMVHDGNEDGAVGRVFLGDGTVLRVVSRLEHYGHEVHLAPTHLPEEVATLIETVHTRLEAKRAEIMANMEAGIWGGEFNADGTPKVPPYDRSRISAVVVSPLQVGQNRVVVNIGGYGESRAAQYIFESPITKLIGND